MKIELDEHGATLTIDGDAFEAEVDGTFEVLAFSLRGATLADLPVGAKVRLVHRIGGSRDTFPASPACEFERVAEREWLAHTHSAFTLEDERISPVDRIAYLRDTLAVAREELAKLEGKGLVLHVEESLYDDIAYVKFSVRLDDQPFEHAQEVVSAVEVRMHRRIAGPLLFLCHASEDKTIAERLVHALDRSALDVWFAKREVLVGESIVARIQEALGQVRYVVVLLSRSSVRKSWIQREWNSTLNRQLQGEAVRVIPVRLDNCEMPPLLADLRYADFRGSFESGYADLVSAIRRRSQGLTE